MAKHETKFEAADEAGLSPGEAISVAREAGAAQAEAPPSRADALACFLAAGKGWDEAVRRLAGAFADVRPAGAKKD